VKSLIGKTFLAWDFLVGLLVPSFTPGLLENSNSSSLGNINILNAAAKRALIGNASFLLEPNFRQNTLLTLRAWGAGQLDYITAQSELEKTFAKRGLLATKITPGSGIARTLMAFGFFTASRLALASPIANLQTGLQPRVAEVGIFLRNRRKTAQAVIRDIKSNRTGVQNTFSSMTQKYFDNYEKPPQLASGNLARTCLVVGPSQIDRLPNPADFDMIIIMVTNSNDFSLLKERIKILNAAVILNGETASASVSGILSSEWVEVLKTARTIFCPRNFVGELARLTGAPTFPRESKLMHLWGNVGGPNMLHITLGLLIEMGMKAHVIGANLYCAEQIYEQSSSSRTEAQRGNFYTCLSQAHHDTATNFIIAKKLMASGYIKGDDSLTNILGMALREYLAALDKFVGSKRR